MLVRTPLQSLSKLYKTMPAWNGEEMSEPTTENLRMDRDKFKSHCEDTIAISIDRRSCYLPSNTNANYPTYIKQMKLIYDWASFKDMYEATFLFQPRFSVTYKSGWTVAYRPNAIVKENGLIFIVKSIGYDGAKEAEALKEAEVYRDIYLAAHPEVEPEAVIAVGL